MSNKIQAIIIDDEALARKRLQKLLTPYSDKIEITGEAANGEEGLKLIKELGPDCVFLDIQMPLVNGFEMLQQLSSPPFIVFTTAYDEYALKAFDENTIDYLLKPISENRIKKTIEKLEQIQVSSQSHVQNQEQIQAIVDQLKAPKTIKSITINSGDKIIILKLTEIVYFQSEDKLTTVVTSFGKEYFVSHSLSQLIGKLPDNFIRVNRAFIINENEIAEIRKGFSGKIMFTMKDENRTKISSGSAYTTAIKERWKF